MVKYISCAVARDGLYIFRGGNSRVQSGAPGVIGGSSAGGGGSGVGGSGNGGGSGDGDVPSDKALSDILDAVIEHLPYERPAPDHNALQLQQNMQEYHMEATRQVSCIDFPESCIVCNVKKKLMNITYIKHCSSM